MPRKAEAHKPFAVKFFGHFFQQFNTTSIARDKIVVGGKCGRNFSLRGFVRDIQYRLFLERCILKPGNTCVLKIINSHVASRVQGL
ncbi:hypothetical protein D9M71_585390 [compost metagenome]